MDSAREDFTYHTSRCSKRELVARAATQATYQKTSQTAMQSVLGEWVLRKRNDINLSSNSPSNIQAQHAYPPTPEFKRSTATSAFGTRLAASSIASYRYRLRSWVGQSQSARPLDTHVKCQLGGGRGEPGGKAAARRRSRLGCRR